MTSDLQTSAPDLLAALDPERNYGPRTYQQVVDAVRRGELTLMAGQNLPVIKDVSTGKMVAGSGQLPQTGVSNQQRALHRFRQLALDDVDDAYGELRTGMKAGDPRFHKIYWENLVGKMGEARGGEAMAEAVKALAAIIDKPDVRTVTIDQ